mgnify:CR=1 FL=1
MKRFANKLMVGDFRLLYFINHKLSCKVLDSMMPLITHLGGAIFTITFTLALMFFGTNSVRLLGYEVAFSLASSHLIVHIVKRKVNRERPHIVEEMIQQFDVPLCEYSFPSGHTTAAFAVANILAYNLPQFATIILGIATLIAISRMYLGVHYPSDVIAGFLVATTFARMTHYLFDTIL